MKAYDIMTTSFVAAKESETLMEINNKLLLGEFNGVPIIDNRNAVIGMITSVDILKALRDQVNIDALCAKEVMVRNPITVNKETSVENIIDLMVDNKIVLVPVVQEPDDILIGIVTRLDILRLRPVWNLPKKFSTMYRF
jgi:tRNA nucleotidyltransferase (CCA-adding enzyme)